MTTMTLTSNASGPFARAVRVAGAVAFRTVEFYRSFKARREMLMLAGFDDRMLADIGLNRSDLRDAVAEPLWRDPTNVLVTRVSERRRSRPAQHPTPAEVAAPSIVPASADRGQVTARYY